MSSIHDDIVPMEFKSLSDTSMVSEYQMLFEHITRRRLTVAMHKHAEALVDARSTEGTVEKLADAVRLEKCMTQHTKEVFDGLRKAITDNSKI